MSGWMDSQINLAARTATTYQTYCELFLTWLEQRLGRDPLPSDLSRGVLEAYRAHLLKDRKRSTAAKHLGPLQLMWAWAYDQDDRPGWDGVIPRARKVELPRPARRTIVAPSWAQWDRMMLELRTEWTWRLGVLVRYTGMRRSAALLVDWQDVNLRRRELRVRDETSKGGYSGRLIPLHPALQMQLAAWGPQHAGLVLGAPAGEVLAAQRQGRGKADHHFRGAWQRARQAEEVRRVAGCAFIDLPEALFKGRPIHCARSMLESELARKGVAQESIDALLGHAAQGTGQRYYRDHRVGKDLAVTAVQAIPLMGKSLGDVLDLASHREGRQAKQAAEAGTD